MLLCTVALSAYSITDGYFGNRVYGFDSRSFGLGNTGVFDELRPFGISNNPANLTLMRKSFGLQGGLNLTRNEDTRLVPLYNSFDNYIDDAVYASNINAYDDYAGLAFATKKMLWLRSGIAVYHKPLISYDGNFEEQIRNNRNTDNDVYPEAIARNSIENEGLLNQLGIAMSIGVEVGDDITVNLGHDYSFLEGKITEQRSIRWTDWARNTVTTANPAYVLPDSTFTQKTELSGHQFKFGAAVKINQRFGFGLVYVPKAKLDRSGSFIAIRDSSRLSNEIVQTGDIDELYILPAEYRIGINYQPRNVMRTWFNLDAEFVRWSDVNKYFEDAVNFYAGVEHHVQNRLPLRLGFQSVSTWRFDLEKDVQTVNGQQVITDVYITKRTITPMITGGSSIQLTKGLNLDLGFGYSWREYEALDLFRDTYYNDKLYTGQSSYLLWPNQYINLKDRNWDNPDKIRENFINFNTSISYTW